jgi:sulfatase maturation enzyme AslB (radical SAM superfamily)
MNNAKSLNGSPVIGITPPRITPPDVTRADEWRAYEGVGRYESVLRVNSTTGQLDPGVELNPGGSRPHVPDADVESSCRISEKSSAKPTGIKAFIAQWVNHSGFLANTVYDVAYYLQWLQAFVVGLYVSVRKLRAEKIYPYRSLSNGKSMQTAVTNICNAKCAFCAYPRVVHDRRMNFGVMSFEVFKKAVDEWATLGGENLDLTPTVGDTLIDPGLLSKIQYAVGQARIKNVVLTTNGILLNKGSLYQRLIDSGIGCIYISTQGTDRKAYKEVYGVDCYEQVISGLTNLLEYNRVRGNPVYVGIRFRNVQRPSEILASKDFIECIRPYLCDKVECNFTVDYDNWGGSIASTDLPRVMRLRRLPLKTNVPCVGLFNYTVLRDGRVRLCGCRFKTSERDDMIVGDIKTESMEEVSKGNRVWEIIEGFYAGKRPEACEECTFYRPVTRKWLSERVRRSNSTSVRKPLAL